MRSDLSAHQRTMLARAYRQQELGLGSSQSMTTLASLRRRRLVHADGWAGITDYGRAMMPLDDVVRELELEREGLELGAPAMSTLSGIRVRLGQAGHPFAKANLERAVLNALLVLEAEDAVRGYTLDRGRFDYPDGAGDDRARVPVGDAYWVALVTPVHTNA